MAAYFDDGELRTRPGVEIARTVPDPLEGGSVGLVYEYRDRTYWALLDPSGGTTERAFAAFPTFDYWLADQVAMENGDPTLALVRFGEGDRLVALEGVEVLRQSSIELADGTAGVPRVRSAVAEVTYEDRRWYVVARQIGSQEPEYFPAAAEVTEPTLTATRRTRSSC